MLIKSIPPRGQQAGATMLDFRVVNGTHCSVTRGKRGTLSLAP